MDVGGSGFSGEAATACCFGYSAVRFNERQPMRPKRIVVGMTGATGAALGIRLLEVLREQEVETHLIVSKWAHQTLAHETSRSLEEVRRLAAVSYAPGDMAAPVSSGSFRTDGMIVAPCSVSSLAAIAQGVSTHLIHRAADVTLKEQRRLVLVVRETPLSEIHLRNMLRLRRMGAVILPPMPAFYNRPKTVDALIDHLVGRMLDQIGIDTELAPRWAGMPPAQP